MRAGRIMLALGAVAVATAAFAAPAESGQQAAPLTIVKQVVGVAPAGTQFVVDLNCENGNNTLDQVTFDEFGNPLGPVTTFFTDPDECTPTETQTGGASSVSYSCVGAIPDDLPPIDRTEPPETGTEPPETGTDAWPSPQGDPISDPCQAAGPQSDPIVVFIEQPDQDATVTIVNTFPPPEPAPLAVEPAFTG